MDENQKSEEAPEDAIDQAFMRGYDEEEEINECNECGEFVKGEPVQRTVDGEKFGFCSKDCATDFQDGMS